MTPKASNRGPAIEDGGRLLTVARSIGPTGVGAEVLAYENWPDQPILDLVLETSALGFAGSTTDGVSCEIRDPAALRDLAQQLIEVADRSEAANAFSALSARRRGRPTARSVDRLL